MSDLAALRAEVAELREDVQVLTRMLLASEDRRVLARLLPAAWGAMGTSVWTVTDLANAAAASGPHGDALATLLDEYVGPRSGLRAFGNLLARLEGATLGGLRLERRGTSAGGHGVVYGVRALRGLPPSETALPSGGEDGVREASELIESPPDGT